MRPVNTRIPNTAAQIERRWSQRQPLRSLVEWSARLRQPILYRAQDIGEDGMSLIGPVGLALGARGVVTLMLPASVHGEGSVEIAAFVVNRRPAREHGYRLGLQYEGLCPGARELILKFLGTAACPAIRGQFDSVGLERSL
jgi:PilZ domain